MEEPCKMVLISRISIEFAFERKAGVGYHEYPRGNISFSRCSVFTGRKDLLSIKCTRSLQGITRKRVNQRKVLDIIAHSFNDA